MRADNGMEGGLEVRRVSGTVNRASASTVLLASGKSVKLGFFSLLFFVLTDDYRLNYHNSCCLQLIPTNDAVIASERLDSHRDAAQMAERRQCTPCLPALPSAPSSLRDERCNLNTDRLPPEEGKKR